MGVLAAAAALRRVLDIQNSQAGHGEATQARLVYS